MVLSMISRFRRGGAFRRSARYTKMRWDSKLGILLTIAALISGFSTYGAFTNTPPFGDDPDTVFWLLNVDLALLLCLMSLIARRVAILFSGRRRGVAGSKLHVRLVFVFSVLALTPSIIMAGFSIYFYHFGIQSWFSDTIRTAVNEAEAVAGAYMSEHKEVIKADVLAMAHDLDRQSELLLAREDAFRKIIDTQSMLRNLPEAVVFKENGDLYAKTTLSFGVAHKRIPGFAMAQAAEGQVVLLTSSDGQRIRALVRLDNFPDGYLFVGRMVDPVVLSHLDKSKRAVSAYNELQGKYAGLRVSVTIIFIVVALLLMLCAMWAGLLFSRQIVSPIGSLVSASERVKSGDLGVRVDVDVAFDEFSFLAQSFNRMTEQLDSQRSNLIDINRQLDQRRRFTETVLSEVSSGIIGVGSDQRITLVNNRAVEILGIEQADIIGRSLFEIIPECEGLIDLVFSGAKDVVEEQIDYRSAEQNRMTLLLRFGLMLDEEQGNQLGGVLTFDDITELQVAQRTAAWSEVARRIAHEIKNPLTPIQLSAERLKRKYLKEIKQQPEIFEQCTDTIIQHVENIERMVTEFSEFARMPEPKLVPCKLCEVVDSALFLERQARSDIEIAVKGSYSESLLLDGPQVCQVITNIIQNAIDSIDQRYGTVNDIGRVIVSIFDEGKFVYVSFADNGLGFSDVQKLDALFDPYVTHKDKGTGLGLAIVRKVMEEHGGKVYAGLSHQPIRKFYRDDVDGAVFTISFPKIVNGDAA